MARCEMYRRSCGRAAERIDASRRPRIDLRVVKLTGGLRTMSSPPVLPESQAVGRQVAPYSESRRTCGRREGGVPPAEGPTVVSSANKGTHATQQNARRGSELGGGRVREG